MVDPKAQGRPWRGVFRVCSLSTQLALPTQVWVSQGGVPSPRDLCTSRFSSSCRIITPLGFSMNCIYDLI